MEPQADSRSPLAPSRFLRERRGALLAEWEQRTRKARPASRRPLRELLEQLPELLDRIQDLVEATNGGARGESPPRGATPPGVHAFDRPNDGFDLADVVREYALLRQILLELIADGEDLVSAAAARVSRAIDEAIELSVRRFAQASAVQLRAGRQREAESQREAARRGAELRAVIQRIPEAVLIGDERGIRAANPPAMRRYGIREGELPAPLRRLTDRLAVREPTTGDPLTSGELAFERALRGETLSRDRLVRDISTGEERLWRASAAPIEVDGAVQGAVAVVSDVTEEQRAAAQLRETLALAQRFQAVLAHDLRNPLQTVLSAAELLFRTRLDDRQLHLVQRIERSADRMQKLVTQLLDLARARAGKLALRREPMDLCGLLHDAADELSVRARRRVELDCSGVSWGEWDRDRLYQAVSNLLGNADEHGEPGTPIALSLEEAEQEVRIRVTNQGTPIPADRLEQIWEPFSSGTNGRSPSALGLGLGLSIVWEVARAHGGRAEVRSGPEGTTFALVLPRA